MKYDVYFNLDDEQMPADQLSVKLRSAQIPFQNLTLVPAGEEIEEPRPAREGARVIIKKLSWVNGVRKAVPYNDYVSALMNGGYQEGTRSMIHHMHRDGSMEKIIVDGVLCYRYIGE